MQFLSRNPKISFGRVCIKGTGVPIRIIAQRLKAGETIDCLGHDYNLDPGLVLDSMIEYTNTYKPRGIAVLNDWLHQGLLVNHVLYSRQ